MRGIIPLRSETRYEVAWTKFRNFLGLTDTDNPPREHYIQYFDKLRGVETQSYSTLWSTYSMLDYMNQALYGVRLQVYPRITILIKYFEDGYPWELQPLS